MVAKCSVFLDCRKIGLDDMNIKMKKRGGKSRTKERMMKASHKGQK